MNSISQQLCTLLHQASIPKQWVLAKKNHIQFITLFFPNNSVPGGGCVSPELIRDHSFFLERQSTASVDLSLDWGLTQLLTGLQG